MKTTFNTLAAATLGQRMNLGNVDASGIKQGFLVIGKTTGGTGIVKPVSKKEFVEKYASEYESKSQAAKAYYANLGTFTMAARADFNGQLDRGYKLMARKQGATGRLTYTLAQPKADTGSAQAANTEAAKLRKENAELKAMMAKILAKLNGGAEKDEAVDFAAE